LDNDCDGRAEGCGLVGVLGAGEADYKLSGTDDATYFGRNMAVYDVDADGVRDVAAGGASASRNGEVRFALGPLEPGVTSLASTDAVITGEEGGDDFGTALAVIEDWDDDGLDELLVSAPRSTGLGGNLGRVYLIPAPASMPSSAAVLDLWVQGVDQWDHTGDTIVAAGDASGDGVSDLLVAGPHASVRSTYSGQVWLVEGPLTGAVSLEDVDQRVIGSYVQGRLGLAAAGVGDVDGDGFDDVLVSDDHRAGRVLVVPGPWTGTLGSEDLTTRLVGEQHGDAAGASVDRAGDLDGDGYVDLVVGAPDHAGAGEQSGAAYLALGPLSGEGLLADAA
ncbi:MAG: hypothetical protein GY913_28730, partial [Proteobacteria bacterium]|nr:hypothetical protein [Pseudomonadota bacterium]